MSTFGWNLLPSKNRSVNSGHVARAFKRSKVSWPWGDNNNLISTDTKFIFLSNTNRLLNCIPNKERCSTDISWRSFLFEVQVVTRYISVLCGVTLHKYHLNIWSLTELLLCKETKHLTQDSFVFTTFGHELYEIPFIGLLLQSQPCSSGSCLERNIPVRMTKIYSRNSCLQT